MSTEIQGSLNFTWKRMEKHRKCLWGWQAYPNFCLGGGSPEIQTHMVRLRTEGRGICRLEDAREEI